MKNDHEVKCVILGGGGHAAVMIESLRAAGYAEPLVVLDSDRTRWGQRLLEVPVAGGDELLPELVQRGVEFFVVGLGGTGDNNPRRKLFGLGLTHHLKPLTVVHPSAVVSQSAVVGAGSQILPLSLVNARAKIGANVIVNSAAVIEHDCIIGDHAHVATRAALASTVKVGVGAHIGAGATVRQCINIGEWSMVGAGAVVVRDVPPLVSVVGVPARQR
jgi:sugar O-acyltransferase (sialic acid O-acetyltransferase NeuD family)